MQTTALLFMTALTAFQGQALQLELPHEDGLESVQVKWSERSVPFVRSDDRWFTVIGVDLDTEAGAYPANVTLSYADGRVRTEIETVEVLGKSFPTTELTVAPGFVQLSPENQERAARESREIGAVYATLMPTALWSGPFIVPIPGAQGGRNFGHRRVFNGEPRAPHSGADLSASAGTEIHASNFGRVVLAKDFFFNGKRRLHRSRAGPVHDVPAPLGDTGGRGRLGRAGPGGGPGRRNRPGDGAAFALGCEDSRRSSRSVLAVAVTGFRRQRLQDCRKSNIGIICHR